MHVSHIGYCAEDPGVTGEGAKLVWGSRSFIIRGIRNLAAAGELWELALEEVRS